MTMTAAISATTAIMYLAYAIGIGICIGIIISDRMWRK